METVNIFECSFLLERCTFARGDGTGGTEERLGVTDTDTECEDRVLRDEPSANGATWGTDGSKKCFAEFGATGRNDDGNLRTCIFKGQLLCFLSQCICLELL